MGKVLILGAGSDVAQALAKQLALAGNTLFLAAREVSRFEPLAQDLRIRSGSAVELLEFDATAIATHADFYAPLAGAVDAVYCVFGYLGDAQGARSDSAEAQQILQVNFNGAVSVLDHVAEDFERRGQGSIIGVSSVAGDRGRASNYHYGAAKAGFTAYLSGLRNRLFSAGVTVLTVKPGFIASKMTAELDLPPVITSSPDQVANAIAKAVGRKKAVLYTNWPWWGIMFIFKHVPEFLFKRMKV